MGTCGRWSEDEQGRAGLAGEADEGALDSVTVPLGPQKWGWWEVVGLAEGGSGLGRGPRVPAE